MMGVGKVSKENGGPAFPTVYANLEGHYGTVGLSLRDYFAAKAMQGLCADPQMQGARMSDISRQSYELADTMLAERAQ
jgi:hypothetical protein